jgi:threonine dehydratase
MSERPEAQTMNWSQSILDASHRIRQHIDRTPVEEISNLFPDARARVWAKREDRQETGSFKLRGATNRILRLTDKEKAHGVIAASNGNHGLGVAAAATKASVSAQVYVSDHVASEKARKIEKFGAKIVYAGRDPLDAEIAGRQRAMESGRVFISPYNDPDVLAGQGTVAVELIEQIPDLDAVFVAVGGGGLIGGIGAYLKDVSLHTEIVGCWPENSPVLHDSMKAGWILPVLEKPTVSESTAGGLEEGSITLDVCRAVVDSCVLVSEEEILDAMRLVQRGKQWLIEGAAGVAVAAFLKTAERYEGKTVAIVICGGNLSQKVRDLL